MPIAAGDGVVEATFVRKLFQTDIVGSGVFEVHLIVVTQRHHRVANARLTACGSGGHVSRQTADLNVALAAVDFVVGCSRLIFIFLFFFLYRVRSSVEQRSDLTGEEAVAHWSTS